MENTFDEEMQDKNSGEMMLFRNVHHSVQSIHRVLSSEEYKGLPEIRQLLHIFKNQVEGADGCESGATTCKKPFIVLEGLDASGKTTVSRELAKLMNAELMSTPPECIVGLREIFDKHPSLVRRAFYALGNYIAAIHVERIRKKKPVVMDRFWHSTTAYAIAEQLDGNDGMTKMPAAGDVLYNWPSDLIQPDHVFLLTVDEKTRNQRLRRRKLAVTEEEVKLKDNSDFRSILLEAYTRMDKPQIVFIDSNRTVQDAVQDIWNYLTNNQSDSLP